MMLQRENVLEHVDVFLTTEGREEEVDIDRKVSRWLRLL